ncbi:MAG: thioesterase family protein [Bermanella sp.]
MCPQNSGIINDNVTPALNWDHLNPFVIEVAAQQSDIDSYEHVNNSVYIRWLDECARENSKSVGIDPDTASELGFGMAVRDSHVTYLAAAHLGDNVLIGNWMTKNDGRLRATRQFQVIRVSDGVTLVRATLDYVCINIQSGRPCKMPALFRDNYSSMTEQSK